MIMPQVIVSTEILSALLRLVPALICFDASRKMSPDRPNYVNAPRLFRSALFLGGLFAMTSMADLIDRAITTSPPHPLLTGYTTTVGELFIAIAGYVWLQSTWKPAAVRERLNRRAEVWERLAPCSRREQIIKERRRNSVASLPDVAIGPMERSPVYRESGKPWATRDFPPITDNLEAVIPDRLRKN